MHFEVVNLVRSTCHAISGRELSPAVDWSAFLDHAHGDDVGALDVLFSGYPDTKGI